ncbi:MAG: terminase [Acidobacteria bacterium]|nr:terminase [Acidobacteriota bacterium]
MRQQSLKIKLTGFSKTSNAGGNPSNLTPGQLAVQGLRRAKHANVRLESIWTPQPGPQLQAYDSDADVIGYGGAAGGGKTDLLIGLASTRHRRAIIFRRVFPNARAIIERSREIFGDEPTFRYNETLHLWRLGQGHMLEIGAMQYEDDKKNHQGQARDFIGFDEATEFTETQVRFVMGWNRSTVPGQKCRVVMTFNPPMDEQGDWVTRFFGPWLDSVHPNPAADGEVRWFATVDGKEIETGSEPFEHNGETITPKSRTFFHAKLSDNPILEATGYAATIDAMPEPLRSLLKGNFDAARAADSRQLIPTDWIKAAQQRWREQIKPETRCDALGVDVARGGADQTVIAKRYGNWVANLIKVPGKATPDGPSVASLTLQHYEAGAKIYLDAIGVGTSPLDILQANGAPVIPIVNSERSIAMDKSRKLKFRNLRAEIWWKLREALDPANGDNLALPPDRELLADLAAPRWSITINGVLIESKDDIKDRIGRSPDCGDAVAMACWLDHRNADWGQFDWIR